MTNVVLALVVGILVSCSIYLLLERALTRVLLGVVLLSNAANILLLLASGPAGEPPIIGVGEPAEMADALPQALILTAIVISFGVTAFVLAMAYRSWQIDGRDDVQDDVEDAMVRRRSQRIEAAQSFADLDEDPGAETGDREAAEAAGVPGRKDES
ncbi:MAG: Na(+)/H(+) antiporter subunit C [Actinomycetota bacterium]